MYFFNSADDAFLCIVIKILVIVIFFSHHLRPLFCKALYAYDKLNCLVQLFFSMHIVFKYNLLCCICILYKDLGNICKMCHLSSSINGNRCSIHFVWLASRHRNDGLSEDNEMDNQCPHCEMIFSTIKGFKKHMKSHDRVHQCTICGILFSPFAALRSHMRTHIYNCPHCQKICRDRRALRCHLKIHNKSQACNICNKSFILSSELRKHTAMQHEDHSLHPLKCSECDKRFIDSSHLNKHMKQHTRPFWCQICPKKFGHNKLLTMHMDRHEEIRLSAQSQKIYLCTDCPMAFCTSAALKIHVKFHKNVCKICSITFILPSSLHKHMCEHNKSLLKPIVCLVCGMIVSSLHTLKSHMYVHTKPFGCSICDEKFSSKEKVASHLDIHGVVQDLKCFKCKRVCTSWADLVDHQGTHKNVKTQLCTVCGKSFSRKTYRAHLRTHSGEHLYKCQYCEKSFGTLPALRSHDLMHNGEKSHVCNICGRGFLRPRALVFHLRIHTGERPYSCDVCGKTFGNPTIRCIHMKKHQSKEMFLSNVKSELEASNTLFM